MFKKADYGFITDIKKVRNLKSYRCWNDMIRRCYNQNGKSYKTYGARGVTVCEEWKLFSNFKKWYDENYIEGYVIDKDMSGLNEYSPAGCVFISKSKNSREAMSRRIYAKGKCHHNSKNIDYYKTKPTFRATFKDICKAQGWNFEDFEESDSGVRSGRIKKYFYTPKQLKQYEYMMNDETK